MVEPFTAWYVEPFGCFELCKTLTSDITTIDPKDLNDSHCISTEVKHYFLILY